MPCSRFELTKRDHQLLCFHYTNLQPLWAEANAAKSDHVITHQPELVMPI